VRLRHVLHDREAQAGAGELARVVRSPEAVEHTRRVLGGDTGPVIAYRDLAVADGHIYRRAWRAVLRGVVQKICDRPGHADLHAVDRRRGGCHVELDLRITEGHVIDDLVHDLVELELLERHRRLLLARDLDQISDEGGETLHLQDKITKQLLTLDGISRLATLEELEVRT
jgi:hypothetical protein